MEKIQKLREDLIIVIPKDISEKLDIKEGVLLDMEPFTCCGESGIRLKLKK